MNRRDLLATYMVDLLTTTNVDLWAIDAQVLPYKSAGDDGPRCCVHLWSCLSSSERFWSGPKVRGGE